MDTPEIIFKYSWIYDQHWKEWGRLHDRKASRYPSSRRIFNHVRTIQKLWENDEKKILEELSLITRLRWKEDVIYCYVVGKCIPFSDPLTLDVYDRYPDYSVDTLVHELIHRLFTQSGNMERSEKAWKYVHRKYRKESRRTRIHIPLHAIHSHIYLKFFNGRRLQRDISLISFLPDYKKAWEIVQNEGYGNIIREFVKRIR